MHSNRLVIESVLKEKKESKRFIDAEIKASWHGLFKMYNQIALQYGSTQAIAFVLMNIKEEGIPATQIAPLMGMQGTSISRILKQLEEQKYVYRERDTNDKRMVRVFLTEKGKEKKNLAQDTVKGFTKVLESCITEQERTVFFEVIDKLNQSVIKYRKAYN